MGEAYKQHAWQLLAIALLAVGVGCKGSWWPLGGKVTDTVPGITPPRERILALKEMTKLAAKSTPEEREQMATQVVGEYPHESDPLVRLEMIRTLGACPGPTAEATLREAIKDKDADVRIAVCKSLAKQKSPGASQILQERLSADTDFDVRLAAAEGLGEVRDPGAVPALGTALADRDPAMQYRAVSSLRKIAPVDLGNDVDRWRQYAKDGSVAPAKPVSVAERLRGMF